MQDYIDDMLESQRMWREFLDASDPGGDSDEWCAIEDAEEL